MRKSRLSVVSDGGGFPTRDSADILIGLSSPLTKSAVADSEGQKDWLAGLRRWRWDAIAKFSPI